MIVYILAHAIAALLMVGALWAARTLETASARRRAAQRTADQTQQQGAPLPLYHVHSGDYSALATGSIEGTATHVPTL